MAPDVDDLYQKAMLHTLGVFAELETEMAQRRSDPEHAHGPAPLGFEKYEGSLIEGDNCHDVCAIIDMVASGDLLKRRAAGRLDTSQTTIRSAIKERSELYGLN